MMKNILAVLLAFILAAGICILGFKNFMNIDVVDLGNQYKAKKYEEQILGEPHKVQASITQDLDLQSQEYVYKDGIEEDDFSKEFERRIINKYEDLFLAMEEEYETKIENLILRASIEYKNLLKHEKENAIFTLGFKYLNLAAKLEEECDYRFNEVLEQMALELENNHLSKDKLIHIRKSYEQSKIERRDFFMEKILEKSVTVE